MMLKAFPAGKTLSVFLFYVAPSEVLCGIVLERKRKEKKNKRRKGETPSEPMQ
jgi:hypothetical protein